MPQRVDESFQYDVALSFAGEDRPYVDSVAEHLTLAGVRVFYDKYEQPALWGTDLYQRLDEVYRRKAKYCVMFISQAYRDKIWTNHELKSAQARAFQESKEYILPARFDDTDIPGIRATLGYVDLRQKTPQELAEMVLAKLGRASALQNDSPATQTYRIPRTGRRNFNPYDEALNFVSRLVTELKRRCDAHAGDGVSATVFDRVGRKCFRVVLDGQPIYSLDVWMGGLGQDSSLQFYGAQGEGHISTGSINAWADFVWDQAAGRAILDFHNLSLLDHMPDDKRFTSDDLIEAIWGKVCDMIEKGGQ